MLKNDNKSYPDSDEEHTFENEDLKKANRKLNNLYRYVEAKLGVNDANTLFECIKEIITWIASEAEKQVDEYKVQENERRRINRNRWIKLILFCLFLMISTSILFKYLQLKNGWEFWGTWGTICGELVLLFIGTMIGIPKVARLLDPGETFIEGICNTCKELVNVIRRMSILHIFMIGWIAVSLGGLFAKIDVFAKISVFVNGGYLAVVGNQSEDTALVYNSTITKEAKMYLISNDAELVKVLEDVYIPSVELVYEENLSMEDYEMVFFINEKYGVIDWENQEHINQIVLQMVGDFVQEKTENIFDKDVTHGGAPSEICSMINFASEYEDEVDSFADLNNILGIRTDAYSLYPKKSLANLISNDYHKLALVFALNGGNENTIVYYYGKSIGSNFECLKYAENSDESIKDRLKRISQRYTDIVYVCPKHESSEKAKKLAVAFKNAADQY